MNRKVNTHAGKIMRTLIAGIPPAGNPLQFGAFVMGAGFHQYTNIAYMLFGGKL